MNICIVGAGFGGIKAALELSKQQHKITLISNSPYFQYYPALYSTATGHSHRKSWIPVYKMFENNKHVTFVEDTLVSIDPKSQTIQLASKKHQTYDKLILALGSVTTYFGIEGLNDFAYGIKSEAEIRRLQKHLIDEMSDGKDDEVRYVIIGAGPTGVELAGALGEYVRTLRKKFGIQKKTVRISVIEAAPRVLPRMSKRASQLATKRLRALGVKIELNKKVEMQTANSLIINGKPLPTQTVIWTSGVANVDFYKRNSNHFSLNERGKVIVDEYMRASRHIYVIGDNAATAYAGLAQTALHDAIFVAKHIGGSKKKYKVVLPPSVVPIGRNWALFEWKSICFGGLAGSLLREAADIVGYHDVLPLGWALGAWRSGREKQILLPESLER